MMKTLIVYFSKFGHTQMVAEAIGETLQGAGSVRLISADLLETADLEGADLVVMGTPTHKMNLPAAVKPVLENLPRRCLRGVQFAAFDTSYKMSRWLMPFTAAKRLNHKLKRLGGRPIAPPETFFVMEREGPLYDGEIDRARRWASVLLAKIKPLTAVPA